MTESSRSQAREIALLCLVAVSLLVILGRMWYLQVAIGDDIKQQAERTRTKTVRQMPLRGRIYDRRGELIATVVPEDVVAMVPNEVKGHPEVLRFVSEILDLPVERIQKIFANAPSKDLPTPIFVGVTPEQVVRLSEERYRYPGLRISEQPIRYYKYGDTFSHAVGYVGPTSEADVKQFTGEQFDRSDFVGKVGIEREHELLLHGYPGVEAIEINARGKMIGEGLVTDKSPTSGDSLTLSLDVKLQRTALDLLKGRRGAVVALDPATGEILALAASPSYDANLFAKRILPDDWASLRDDPAQPLLNRALQSAYPPGSPFKLVTAIAGFESGTLSTGATNTCTGGVRVGNRVFKCHRTHGFVDFTHAISLSCDSFFYQVGIRAGKDALVKAALDCGFGARSGIDLPSERIGVVPTDEWLKKRKFRWVGGDAANSAIGQGYLIATPLQMADLAALIANHGTIYRPHLLRSAKDMASGKTTFQGRREAIRTVPLQSYQWDALSRGMVQCIEAGTATRNAYIPGLRWAGKTGSAEHGSKSNRTHAWFIGYAPADHPKIAVAVLVEQAGHGGDVAAPIAKEIVKSYLMRPASPSAKLPASDPRPSAAGRRELASAR